MQCHMAFRDHGESTERERDRAGAALSKHTNPPRRVASRRRAAELWN